MADTAPAYGLWGSVLINSVVFIFFGLTFFKPQTPRDWRSFGMFSAFIVALFAEMYGFPLTLYVLSGWLQSRYPDVNWLSHDAGHAHVLVDRDDVDAFLAHRLEHGLKFSFIHREIPIDDGFIVGASERSPGIDAHFRTNPDIVHCGRTTDDHFELPSLAWPFLPRTLSSGWGEIELRAHGRQECAAGPCRRQTKAQHIGNHRRAAPRYRAGLV